MKVIDASYTAALLMPDEGLHLSREEKALAIAQCYKIPYLWHYEMRNILISNVRRKRLTAQQFEAIQTTLLHMNLEEDFSAHHKDIMDIAQKYNLTFYDATYLELARRRSLSLATFDKAMQKAAKKEGVEVFKF